MELLHTEYKCEDCGLLFKKIASIEHRFDTGHKNILKKIIHPRPQNTVDKVTIDLDATQELSSNVDYCLECRKEVMMPQLHKDQGHSVYKKKG